MRVAFLHYHYRPGGVTRVIENTLPHLRNLHDIDAQIIEHPGLNYANPDDLTTDPATLTNELQEQARKQFGAPPDLWHIHNPTLGKHPSFPQVLSNLANSQTPLLLHIHDFAEDCRPGNYQLIRQNPHTEKLYPIGEHIHYATLHQRDYQILNNVDIPSSQLHLLPNPIVTKTQTTSSSTSPSKSPFHSKQLHLYPVRATTRKNLGELALWAALADQDHHFANSIGPTNPNQRASYQRWKQLASELELPLTLGLCEAPQFPFPEVLANAASCVTTSRAEGFGLSFLEPTLIRKPLWGRNIPDITKDFTQHGIDLSHLYTRIDIPLDFLDAAHLKLKLQSQLQALYDQYATPLPTKATETAWEALTLNGDTLDFGHLDQDDQIQIIRQLHQDPKLRDHLPKLSEFTNLQAPHDDQAALIRTNYCPEQCADKLSQIYQKLLSTRPETPTHLDPDKILSQFLHPARFSYLLT